MQPFSYAEYRYILTSLKEKGYRFVNYKEANLNFYVCPFVIIRHDVDVSLQKAVKMAQIEYEMGVNSIYFLMTTSEAYNIRSQKSLLAINKLRQLRHEIVINFDANIYKKTEKTLRKAFYADLHLFYDFIGKPLSSEPYVSYHMPSSNDEKLFLAFHVDKEPFLTKIKYFSDSYGKWRFGHPLNSKQFREEKPLHLNFHPIWWQGDYAWRTPLWTIEQFKEDRSKVLNQWIDRNIWGGK